MMSAESRILSAFSTADVVFILGMALCLIGLIALMSAGAFIQVKDGDAYHDDPYRLVKRQAVFLLAALAGYVAIRRVPLKWFDSAARIGLAVTLGLLLLVLFIGTEGGNATRWFRIGPVSVQPSELAKLALIVYLAHYLSRYRARLHDFRRGVMPAVAVIAAVAGLTALEPDLGTALLLTTIGFMMLLVAGVRVRHLLPFVGAGLPAVVLLMAFKFEHILPRLRAFLDPMQCYQTKQSLLALGTGGWLGAGLGEGRQKLAFLPQVHGDFLFACIGEELGLIGTCTVLALFAGLVVFGVRLLGTVRDPFRFFLGTGLVGMIGLQAAINIAVVTASVPPKGIALPFLSQGGTSLVVMVAGLGLLVSAGVGAEEAAAPATVTGQLSEV